MSEFTPFGAADKIKLSIGIVQKLIANPTKSGKTCSETDALKFIALCKAQRLNPFAGDAFLVGYDSQNGPTYSLITAHQAFLKRAETSPDFDGMTSGILVEKDGNLEEREGDFHFKDENVVGGWAKVFHKKRAHPTYRKIRMERFNKGRAQWVEDPAGMICKCAEADALRSTFPTLLGGLYIEGERPIIDISPAGGDLPLPKVLVNSAPAELQEAPAQEAKPAAAGDSFGDAIVNAGFTFDDFQKRAGEAKWVADADSFGGFDEIPASDQKRLYRIRAQIIESLAKAKEGLGI